MLLPALMEGHARGRNTLIERDRTKAGRLDHWPRESPLGTKYCLPASGTMSDQVAGPKNRICTAGTLREIFSRLPTARMSERGLRENVAEFARASRHSTGGTSGPRHGQRRYTVLQCALLKLSTIRGGGNSGTGYGRLGSDEPSGIEPARSPGLNHFSAPRKPYLWQPLPPISRN